jgi:hypothetical protein
MKHKTAKKFMVLQKEKKTEKKRGKRGPLPPLKKECHSHIAPVDKKEWHSSFARNLGSGTHERRSKECRSCTHWIFVYTWLFPGVEEVP